MDVAIYDAVVVFCFTLLACFFGKWWIVLFAALFLASKK